MSTSRVAIALAFTLTLGLAGTAPAWASLASDTFKDVPDGHWAQDGVAEVAIKRDLMKGYPDGTFRGDQPFTRAQFADSLANLIKELETQSKISWRPEERPLNVYADLDPGAQREEILMLANDYGLFAGVQGMTGERFNPDRTVTRFEMAKIINNLLRLGESKDVIRPEGKVGEGPVFTDVATSDWAYQDMQDVSQRYRVMIGFPDHTFRGPEELTRFQYAQAISQTVPLIRQLIEKTTEIKHEEKRMAEGPWRLQETTPLQMTWDHSLTPSQFMPTVHGRLVNYPSNLFVMSDLRVQMQSSLASGIGSSGGGTATDLAVGIGPKLSFVGSWFNLPALDALQLQPYLGPRVYLDAAPNGTTYSFGGLQGGAIAYYRLTDQPFAVFAKSGLGGLWSFQQAKMSSPLFQLEFGGEVYVLPKLAIAAGVTVWDEVPTSYPTTLAKFNVLALRIGAQFGF